MFNINHKILTTQNKKSIYGNLYTIFLHRLQSLWYTIICAIVILAEHILLSQNKQTRKSTHLANVYILLLLFCQIYIPKYALSFIELLYVHELGDVQCLLQLQSVHIVHTFLELPIVQSLYNNYKWTVYRQISPCSQSAFHELCKQSYKYNIMSYL
jgi:hypothetical protein